MWNTIVGVSGQRTTITVLGKKLENTETSDYVLSINESGEDCSTDNALITDDTMAFELASRVRKYLSERKKYNIEYVGNPELDINDVITMNNQFLNGITLRLIKHEITYNGALSGKIEGKEVILEWV